LLIVVIGNPVMGGYTINYVIQIYCHLDIENIFYRNNNITIQVQVPLLGPLAAVIRYEL